MPYFIKCLCFIKENNAIFHFTIKCFEILLTQVEDIIFCLSMRSESRLLFDYYKIYFFSFHFLYFIFSILFFSNFHYFFIEYILLIVLLYCYFIFKCKLRCAHLKSRWTPFFLFFCDSVL